MAGIDIARQNYEKAVPSMRENYVEGMSAFFGKNVGNALPVQKYESKIGPASGAKWERNLRRAFGA